MADETIPGGQPTALIAGRYELRELLGGGGMGQVYRAFDRELEREVAVKSIHAHLVDKPDLVERFRREGRALARVRHPGIVGLHDMLRSAEGSLYLIMELVEGEGLEDVLRRGPLPWTRCVEIGTAVCDALQEAHGAGIIHRDIKPANVLLERDGRVRVADFGIARLSAGGAITHTATAIGTPEYWAPEQAMGKPVTAATDVYGVAALLFEMGTGRPPYMAEEGGPAAAYMHLVAPVPDPGELAPQLPEAARAAIMRGLAKEPGERFATAAEMATALRESAGLPEPPAGTPIPQAAVVPEALPPLPAPPASAAPPTPPPRTPDTARPPPPPAAEPAREPRRRRIRILGMPAPVAGLLGALVVIAAGVGIALALTMGGEDFRAAAEGESSPAIAIPDDDPAGVTDTIALDADGFVRELDLQVDITHPFVGDLEVTLRSPSGARAVLREGEGGGDNDLSLRLDARDAELEPLIGEEARGEWELLVADVGGADEGVLEDWSLSVQTSAEAAEPEAEPEPPAGEETEGESFPAIAIPDDDPAGVTDAIALDADGVVDQLDVQVDITHPFVGDLEVVLRAPSGARAVLREGEGGADDDLSLRLASADDAELEPLIGEEARGEWELVVRDESAADEGTLEMWSLQVQTR